jgi:hypothetical protein
MTDLPPRFRLVLVRYDYAKARGNQILSFCQTLAVMLAHWAKLLNLQAVGWQEQALPAEE